MQYIPVTSPHNAKVIGHVPLSTAADVEEAVRSSKKAFLVWAGYSIKERAAILIRFHVLMTEHIHSLAELVVLEHGKNKAEAVTSVMRGQELVEYAISLPHVALGKHLEVSKHITCHDTRVRRLR